MKITEITEGYTNENWKDTGFGKFAQAAGGAIKRQAADAVNTGMAKMGSGKAQGKQEMQRVVGGVIKNFQRYLGQTKGKATSATLQQYLKALGIQNPVMESPQQPDMFGGKSVDAKTSQDVAQRKAQMAKNATVKPAKVLNRNQLFDIISKNIQQAMQAGTLPKELKKFLGQ